MLFYFLYKKKLYTIYKMFIIYVEGVKVRYILRKTDCCIFLIYVAIEVIKHYPVLETI